MTTTTYNSVCIQAFESEAEYEEEENDDNKLLLDNNTRSPSPVVPTEQELQLELEKLFVSTLRERTRRCELVAAAMEKAFIRRVYDIATKAAQEIKLEITALQSEATRSAAECVKLESEVARLQEQMLESSSSSSSSSSSTCEGNNDNNNDGTDNEFEVTPVVVHQSTTAQLEEGVGKTSELCDTETGDEAVDQSAILSEPDDVQSIGAIANVRNPLLAVESNHQQQQPGSTGLPPPSLTTASSSELSFHST
eukprot:PhM_4_TR16956/c0_g1_i1/m.74452